jgi:hypothetical protein
MDTPTAPSRPLSEAGAASTSGRGELERVWERFACAVIRGATAGATIRGGLHVIGLLVSVLSRQRRKRSVSARAAIEDTARYTAFLAALAAIYVGVDEGIAAAWGKQRWGGRAWLCMAPAPRSPRQHRARQQAAGGEWMSHSSTHAPAGPSAGVLWWRAQPRGPPCCSLGEGRAEQRQPQAASPDWQLPSNHATKPSGCLQQQHRVVAMAASTCALMSWPAVSGQTQGVQHSHVA